jgi:hypothetical protein
MKLTKMPCRSLRHARFCVGEEFLSILNLVANSQQVLLRLHVIRSFRSQRYEKVYSDKLLKTACQ